MKIGNIVISIASIFGLQHSFGQNNNALGSWISKNNAIIKGRLSQYDYDRYNVLTNKQSFVLKEGKTTQQFLGGKWSVSTKAVDVADRKDAIDLVVTFHCLQGGLQSGSVSIDVDFGKWSEKNYVLMPAAAYNGNRYPYRRLRYSPKLYEIQDYNRMDEPIIISDVPKLSESGGVSRIQDRSGSMSMPSIGFQSDTTQKGFWLTTEQGNSLGDYGMGIEETRDRKKATISITSPLVREQYNYMICDARHPSWDIPKDFKAGDEATIKIRLYGFDAPTVQTLFDVFTKVRKDFTESKPLANSLPYSACMEVLEKKFNKQNFVPQWGYYAIGMRENFLQDWQIGWTGGTISTYPLLFAGNKETRENVVRNFDWLFPNGISPSGFYYDAGRNGNEWFGGDIRKPQTKNWHLIRKSGDAVWYILKQFMLMEKLGIEVKPVWKNGNKKVCDAMVKLWDKYHQIGQFVDSQTGDIAVSGSTSGAIIPAGLCLAFNYYKDSTYLETAKEVAAYYHDNFTKKGITCGGPGDALQNFDSESSCALIESYITLYEISGDKQWLGCAEEAAKQFATWVVSYDYHFPDTSAYGKAHIRTTGTVYANTQNKHAAPGLCTASGIGLLKLYRYTGNPFYADLLRDIAHHITQYLPHPKKPLGNSKMGWVSERINMTDWEGVENIGYVLSLSTWAETSLMLTTVEIPGLYVQPKLSKTVVFDNVEVKTVVDNATTYSISVYNPTPLEAKVSIMEENGKVEMLGENSSFGLKSIHLLPGERTTISFNK